MQAIIYTQTKQPFRNDQCYPSHVRMSHSGDHFCWLLHCKKGLFWVEWVAKGEGDSNPGFWNVACSGAGLWQHKASYALTHLCGKKPHKGDTVRFVGQVAKGKHLFVASCAPTKVGTVLQAPIGTHNTYIGSHVLVTQHMCTPKSNLK